MEFEALTTAVVKMAAANLVSAAAATSTSPAASVQQQPQPPYNYNYLHLQTTLLPLSTPCPSPPTPPTFKPASVAVGEKVVGGVIVKPVLVSVSRDVLPIVSPMVFDPKYIPVVESTRDANDGRAAVPFCKRTRELLPLGSVVPVSVPARFES